MNEECLFDIPELFSFQRGMGNLIRKNNIHTERESKRERERERERFVLVCSIEKNTNKGI